MDFYNLFSFSAKKAIYRASEICAQFNHQYLEPEHIFFSILNLRSCSAVEVLHQLGVNLPKLTYSLEAWLYENVGSYKGQANFSARTLALLDASYKEVKRLHQREIGTTHLLVALAQDRGAFLRQLFEEHELNDKCIRDTFMTHLRGIGHAPERSASEAKKVPTEEEFAKLIQLEALSQLQSDLTRYFSPKAWIAIALAETLAKRFKQFTLEPEHILYGLLAFPFDPAKSILELMGADTGGLLKRLIGGMQIGTRHAEEIKLGPDTVTLLSAAFGLILRHQHQRIDLPHLLLAFGALDDAKLKNLLGAYKLDLDVAERHFGLQQVEPLGGASPAEATSTADEPSMADETGAFLVEQDVTMLLRVDPVITAGEQEPLAPEEHNEQSEGSAQEPRPPAELGEQPAESQQ